jgi:hypothetical protein
LGFRSLHATPWQMAWRYLKFDKSHASRWGKARIMFWNLNLWHASSWENGLSIFGIQSFWCIPMGNGLDAI